MAGGTWSMKGYYSPFYDIRFILTRPNLYHSDLDSKAAFTIWVSQDSMGFYRD